MVHNITLDHYTAQTEDGLAPLELGTQSSYGLEQLHITPGTGWEGLTVTATFHPPCSEAAIRVLVPKDGLMDVPPEATATGGSDSCGQIIFAGTAEGVQRISTPVAYTVLHHFGIDGTESSHSPTLIEQVLAEMRTKVDSLQDPANVGMVLGIDADGFVVPMEQAQGDIADSSGSAENGGYYLPSVSQLSEDILQITFTPSKQTMPTVAAQQITLPAGKDGVDGQPGEIGPQGPKGETGITPQLTIGTVTTLAAGSEATASLTGTVEAPVLNLGLPCGAASEAGTAAVDTALSATSENPVQNKVILAALNEKLGSTDQSADSARLDGQLPAYYAAAADLTAEITRAKAAESTNAAAAAAAQTAASNAKTAADNAQTTANGKSAVSVSRNLTGGTKIGTITVDGTAYDLYCEKNTDTVYSLPTGNASTIGGVKLYNGVDSNAGVNDGVAATPSAVKYAYDLANTAKTAAATAQTTANGKANASHTHNYAGSSSAGGAADSAVKASGDNFKFGAVNTNAGIFTNDNTSMYLMPIADASYWISIGKYAGTYGFIPNADNKLSLGINGAAWTQVFAKTTTISTSDRNQKTDIADLAGEKAEQFIMMLKPSTFKLIDGQSGRTHWGMIAQDVEEAMTECGLTDMDFAGFIRSPKLEKYDTGRVDDDGNPIMDTREVEGEYTYALRYSEFIAPLIATVQAQQEKIKTMEARLKQLESVLNL